MRQSDSVEKIQQQQRRVLACGLQTGVWLIAAVVLSRRISGDASGFVTQWAACLVGCVAMAVSVLTTSFLKGDDPRASSAEEGLMPEALSLMPGVMLGLALLPAGSGGGLAALLGLFAVAFGVQYAFSTASRAGRRISAVDRLLQSRSGMVGREVRVNGDGDRFNGFNGDATSVLSSGNAEPVQALPARSSRPSQRASGGDGMDSAAPLISASLLDVASDRLTEVADGTGSSQFEPETQQWMSRSRQDGFDVVEGEVQVNFDAGQRLVALHLPFSPPLAATPQFECEGLDETELSFRTTASHTYGVRVEVSRSGALESPATARIGWAASAEINEEATAEESSQSASAA